jgi:bisphosphoglycerate-independent phosphoglycerate mutase (AlkP superfamily)
MSDHGFDFGTTHHHNADNAWIATNLSFNNRDGTMRDIAPTVLEYLGVNWKELKPELRGKSLLE